MLTSINEDFKKELIKFASKAVKNGSYCESEEGSKQYLVLPFIRFLGYDPSNPREVVPEHAADFSPKYKNRVDYVIMHNDEPVIAIECKSVGAKLKNDRGQLKSYFNALLSVKMGVLTDGLKYYFFADSDKPNILDENAFLTIDLKKIAKLNKIEDDLLEGLVKLKKDEFDPTNIGADAKENLIFGTIKDILARHAEAPAPNFVKYILSETRAFSQIRETTIEKYTPMVKEAFKQLVAARIERMNKALDETDESTLQENSKQEEDIKNDIVRISDVNTTEKELSVYAYVKMRLAYLCAGNIEEFNLIENIDYVDFKGKFGIFYLKSKKGRMLNFIEGSDDLLKFHFPETGEKIETKKLEDIDEPLLASFRSCIAAFK